MYTVPEAEPASVQVARGMVKVSVDAESIPVQVVICDGWREVVGSPMSLTAAIQEATRSARGAQLSAQMERVDWSRLRSGGGIDVRSAPTGGNPVGEAELLYTSVAVFRQMTATMKSIVQAEFSNTRTQNDVIAYVSGVMRLTGIDFNHGILDEPASTIGKSVTLALREAFSAVKASQDDVVAEAVARLARL